MLFTSTKEANFSAAIKTDGTLWAWGDNTFGQLGDSTNTMRSSPIQIAGTWVDIATGGGAGNGFCIGTKSDGSLWSWGYNGFGALGDNATGVHRSSPIQIGSMTDWFMLSASEYHAAAIKTDGTLWVWGYNGSGQLGLGDNVSRSSPSKVGSLTTWKSIACGEFHTVAIK